MRLVRRKKVSTWTGRNIFIILIANSLMRIASMAGGALIGFYLAHLVKEGRFFDAGLIGVLGVVVSSAELVGALPFGMLADRYSPRLLMVVSALLGAGATQLFGISGVVSIFYLARVLEGLAAAANTPAILAYLVNVTEGDGKHRSVVMSWFELSLLAGLALGTLVGGLLWDRVNTAAFSWLAVVYLVVALLYYIGTQDAIGRAKKDHFENPLDGFKKALLNPFLRRLAPAWLAMNGIIGLWTTHVAFQLNGPMVAGQYLVGRFTASEVGWLSLIYVSIFAIGILIWGQVLTKMSRLKGLWISIIGMCFVNLGFFLLNLSSDWSLTTRWIVFLLYLVAVGVQSGFTPAALTYLADASQDSASRGVTMGIYTVLLSLGYIIGAGLGGILAKQYYFNGLVVGTTFLLLIVMASLTLLWDDDEVELVESESPD